METPLRFLETSLRTDGSRRVRITDAAEIGGHRVSPIFPLIEDAPSPDLGHGRWVLDFLVPVDAFPVLGKIVADAYPGLRDAVWFASGLASVIAIQCGNDALAPLLQDLDIELLAHERWLVIDGSLSEWQHLRLPSSGQSSAPVPLPRVPAGLPPDLRAIAEESRLSVAQAAVRARGYAPDEAKILSHFAKEIEVLCQEAANPDALDENDGTPISRTRLVQQRMDRLVQINSALSYSISQAYFGAPPILESAGLIQRHSLLGVGRAHRALVNLVREIEAAFNECSLSASIRRSWAHAAPLAGFASGITRLDSSGWQGRKLPDVLLDSPASPDLRKIVHFSGRLGFREAEYSLSAAIQCLSSADTPEWHFSTMTHEALHGHVRDILHTLFDVIRPDDPTGVDAHWTRMLASFREHMRGGSLESRVFLLDSVRHVLLSYCCLVPSLGSLTQPPTPDVQTDDAEEFAAMKVPRTDRTLRLWLAHEEKNISEIMVHVLDLFYFYFDKFEEYNAAIWSSWRAVPAVVNDVRQYVLRSLLACTSLDRGEEIGRFARARTKVLESLMMVAEHLPGDPTIQQALALLRNRQEPDESSQRIAEAQHDLFKPFLASVRVADLARHVLAAGKIRERLFPAGGWLGEWSAEGGVDFRLPAGEFVDRSIGSVAGFCAWRAKSMLANGSADAERRAAWLFLACGRVMEPSEQADSVREGS